jgi:hypothetical protein
MLPDGGVIRAARRCQSAFKANLIGDGDLTPL